MKQLTIWLAMVVLVFSLSSVAGADSYTITAAQVKAVMEDCGAPLSDSTYLWGLWAVRTMPIVTGGGYTITGGSTTQTGWGVSAPNGIFGSSPYTATNSSWFWDASGAEVAGNPPNPLYMIMDQPASSFTSYFGNTVTAVDDTSTFTVNFTLDAGATWDGRFQFVVDGSRYLAGTSPAEWNEDFFGGYGGGGGLACNLEAGYQAPLPGTLVLLGSGLAGLGFFRRRRLAMS